jgi:hypothetical protein
MSFWEEKMGKLDGKKSVVTGIGKGCVETFFEKGPKIAIFILKDEDSCYHAPLVSRRTLNDLSQ